MSSSLTRARTIMSFASLNWDYPHPFIQTIVPQASDIDGLHHVNNAVYVRWCEQAGWAHSDALGLNLLNYEQLNRAVVIRRGEYDYLLPARLGEALQMATWLVSTGKKLLIERRFQLMRPADGAVLMRGRWELVCIELHSGRVRRMPPEFEIYHQAAIQTEIG
jgi:acyl-CoA thioester hydrolase